MQFMRSAPQSAANTAQLQNHISRRPRQPPALRDQHAAQRPQTGRIKRGVERVMDVKTLIVTVLPESEAKAVRTVFALEKEADENSEYPVYYDPGCRAVVSCIIQKGNAGAAIATGYLLDRYKPQNAILIGTCAGRPGQTDVGDVVFSLLGVFDYGQSSLEPGAELRFEAIGAPGELANRFAFLKSDKDLKVKWWPMVLQNALKQGVSVPEKLEPQLMGKAIASGSRIIHEDSMQLFTAANAQIFAADQDTAGFARSCNNRKVDWIAVRGVSDCGDRSTRKSNAEFATIAAASLVKLFLDGGAAAPGGEKPAGAALSAESGSLASLGCTRLWVPHKENAYSENDARNDAKREAMAANAGKSLYLLAQTGYSYLGNRCIFHRSVRRYLQRGGSFHIVLADPSVRDPLYTKSEQDRIQAKYEMALTGYNELRQDFEGQVNLKTIRMNLPATALITDTLCFFEPYIHTANREKAIFVSFEMLLDKTASPYGYDLMLKYFKELYRKGTEYQGEPPYAD